MLSAEDYDADLAERYGWINRALPADELAISSAPSRSASPGSRPPATRRQGPVNAIALAPVEDFQRDSDLFGEGVRDPQTQARIAAALSTASRPATVKWTPGREPVD